MQRRHFLGGMLALGGLSTLGCGSDDTPLINTNTPITTPTPNNTPQSPELEAALDTAFASLRFTSVRAAVVRPGLPIWTGGRGTPELANPFTRVGSVTKTVTGTAALQLVDDGLISLDQTIEKWFPQLPDASQITIRMLGTMASGIASYTLDSATQTIYFANPSRTWTPLELMEISFALPRLFAPGQGFNYSNTNFIMLGHIVEQETGQTIDQFFRSRIFTPLTMKATSYPYSTEVPAGTWTGRTLQGVSDDTPLDSTHWSPTFGGAAGEILSQLADLVIWARALGEGSLLSAATQAERLKPNPFSVSGDRGYLFGLGNTGGWLNHAGDIPGYNTQVAHHPGRQQTIVVIASSDIPTDSGAAPAVLVYDALREAITAPTTPG